MTEVKWLGEPSLPAMNERPLIWSFSACRGISFARMRVQTEVPRHSFHQRKSAQFHSLTSLNLLQRSWYRFPGYISQQAISACSNLRDVCWRCHDSVLVSTKYEKKRRDGCEYPELTLYQQYSCCPAALIILSAHCVIIDYPSFLFPWISFNRNHSRNTFISLFSHPDVMAV